MKPTKTPKADRPRTLIKSGVDGRIPGVPHSGELPEKIQRRNTILAAREYPARPKISTDTAPIVIAAAEAYASDEVVSGGVAGVMRKALIRFLRHEGYLTMEEP